ncbi:DUF3298 and DUF4163 domain-containing protein [Euryhalocaulis caribicus]|uniref:DUF3298 and DUF4163 domain-containing protein n=1 Tax=Euryhalocaulis caribicus TaxID=1161401 RepID=UPI00039B4330|nr:DUF3298 and DUF4163 domain-containing protein [Euryhalocaulis caribicus]
MTAPIRLLLGAAAIIALAACDREAETPAAEQPSAAQDTAETGQAAAEAGAGAGDWAAEAPFSLKEETDTATIEISTPEEVLSRDRALYEQIFVEADAAAEHFKQTAEEGKADAEANDYPFRPYTREVEWAAPFDNGEIASLIGQVWEYTGGAHGNNYYDTLTWSFTESGLLVTSDFFVPNQETWDGLSAIAREKLLQAKRERFAEYREASEDVDPMWMDAIKDATAPEVSSFDLMTLVPSTEDGKAGGIKLYYPPYAVGPYAEGSYEIVLPQADIAQYIAPAYRDLFAGGPAPDPQLNQGGEE